MFYESKYIFFQFHSIFSLRIHFNSKSLLQFCKLNITVSLGFRQQPLQARKVKMFASTRPDLIPPLFCRSQSIWKMARVQMVWPPWRTNLSSTALWLSSSARTFPEKTPSSSLGHPSRASASSQNSANKVCKEVSAADYVCCLFFACSCSFPFPNCYFVVHFVIYLHLSIPPLFAL